MSPATAHAATGAEGAAGPGDAPPRAALLGRPFCYLLLQQVAFGLSFSTFFLLPKYLTTRFGADAGQVGLVMGAFPLGAALVPLLVGPASRRFGPGACLAAAFVAMSAGSFMFLAVTSVGALAIVARLLQGAAATFVFSIGSIAVAALAHPARLTSALALFITSGLVASSVAPPATEWAIGHAGAAAAFTAAGVTALAGVIPSALLARSLVGRAGSTSEALVPAPRGRVRRSRIDRGTLGLAALAVLFGLASNVVFTFHQPLALQRGIHRVSDFLVAFTLTATTLRVTGGRLMDLAGSRRLARWSLAGYAAAMVGVVTLQPGRLAWFGILFGIVHGAFFPSLLALSLELGDGRRESRLAWVNAGTNLGGLGVAALGPVATRLGFAPVFVAVGGLLALAALAFGHPTMSLAGLARPPSSALE